MMNVCVAHRGWSGRAPENTMAAIEMALEHEAVEWIEIDVQLSRDGIPVVIHDFTLQRTTNGKGMVKDYTYDQLSRLDAGAWFGPAYRGQTIPTLEQVLRAAKSKCRINIELKTAGDLYPGLEHKVARLIDECGMQSEVCVTSFDHESVQRIKRIDPSLATGLIISGKPVLLREQLKETGASLLSMDFRYLTADFAAAMIAEGVKIMAWTIDDRKEIGRVASMHSELMICTNYPDRWLELNFGQGS